MANISVADKIVAVEAETAQLKLDLAKTVDAAERAGIRQQIAANTQLLASYQTGMHKSTC
jgi:hypothetical protein